MGRLRLRHISLTLGAASLVSAVFAPWLTISAFYSLGPSATFVWSPFDIVWNALVSVFPNAPEVNAWFIGRASPLIIGSALYMGSAVPIAGFTVSLIRGDLRRANVERTSWPLLALAGLAALAPLFVWGVVPYIYEFSDGSNVDILPFYGPGTVGIALALVGAALAFVALCGISVNAHDRRVSARLTSSGR